MIWLRILVLLIDLYLVLSLGAWFALRFAQWRAQRSRRSLVNGAEALRNLAEGIGRHTGRWPREPRPGRYAAPDELAREHLANLRTSVAEAEALRPSLQSVPIISLTLPQVLALQALPPLVQAVRAWRDARALWRLVDRASASLEVLDAQAQIVDGIPSRTRATLNETRAEATRLTAVLEAVEEQGMQGLERTSWQLAEIGMKAEHALDRLSAATDEPQTVYEIDRDLGEASAYLQEIDRFLGEASEARLRAQNLLTRVYSALGLVEERWQGLQARGAAEPALAAEVDDLRARAQRLPDVERASASMDNYQKVTRQALVLDTDIQAAMQQLDRIDTLMRESKDALGDAQQSLADTMAMCQEMSGEDPTLQPDLSLSLVARAHQLCEESEAHRAEGTMEAYQEAMAAADEALETLTQARQGLAEMPDAVKRVQRLLRDVSIEQRGAWRGRFQSICEGLRAYPVHWDRTHEREAAAAEAALAEAEAALAQAPGDVREGRRYTQTGLLQSVESLTAAQEQMEQAQRSVANLENELKRIEDVHHALDEEIREISERTLPALVELRAQMLPELQQRLDRLVGTFSDESRLYLEPTRVDYDEATDRWLPSIKRQIDELAGEHRSSVRQYHKMQRETVHRIDRLWGRLQRMDPYQLPAPEEDIQALVRDLDGWRAAVEYEASNPASLRDLIAREGKNLERRLQAAIQQIEEDRGRLVALSKDYQRMAATNERIDALVHHVRTESHWARISWGTEEAEEIWQAAVALEEESASARTLTQAVDRLQRAVNAARRAEALYLGTERQISNAIGRLDSDLQTVGRLVDRAQRLEESLRQDQQEDAAQEVAALLAAAGRALDSASEATTFDDALRHLQTARASVERAL